MTLPKVYACTPKVFIMKRRRLLLGLGTVAVGSAAAALTGATLSNTVSPTADFRVSVDSGTEVKAATANPTYDSRGQGTFNNLNSDSDKLSGAFPSPDNHSPADNTTFSPGDGNIPVEGIERQVDFSYVLSDTPADVVGFGTNGGVGQMVAANAKKNDELEVAMNVDLPDNDTTFHAPTAIAITNNGSASKDYAISYTYGPDVDVNGVTKADVARLYQFVDVDPTDNAIETQLSPALSTPGTPGSTLTIGPDETFLIDIRVNLNFTGDQGTNIRTQIADEVGTAGGELQLLSNITVGTQ